MGATATLDRPTAVSIDNSLLSAYAGGDLDARSALAERHMPMARRLASRYRGTSEDRQDLEQIAYVALLKAIDRCDVTVGEFITFAITNIRGELKRHFRDHGWGVSVPRPLKEDWLLVKGAIETLTGRTGHSPTMREIAGHTGLELERVVEALEVSHGYQPLGLDAPLTSEEAGSMTLGDTLGAEERRYEHVEDGTAIAPAFNELSHVQKQIVRMRFIDDLTQTEIGQRLGISQMQVSRLLRRALDSLRDALETA